MDGRDWRDLALLSLLGNLIYYVGLSIAVQSAGVALASLIIGLLPVTVTLVGAHPRKGRPGEGVPLRRLAAPLALVVAGGVCINVSVFTEDRGVGIGRQAVGVLGAILALAMWTAYAVWNARRLAATPKFTSHEWSLLTGLATGLLALLLVVPAFLLGGKAHAPAAWGWFWAVSFAVAIGASVIGNGLWNAASRLLPLSLSGQLIVFETLFALLYGFLHEGRWPRGLETAAIVLMLAGVLWSVRLHRPAAKTVISAVA
jgi:drug/metabolite transporter (DMT)-like permease